MLRKCQAVGRGAFGGRRLRGVTDSGYGVLASWDRGERSDNRGRCSGSKILRTEEVVMPEPSRENSSPYGDQDCRDRLADRLSGVWVLGISWSVAWLRRRTYNCDLSCATGLGDKHVL